MRKHIVLILLALGVVCLAVLLKLARPASEPVGLLGLSGAVRTPSSSGRAIEVVGMQHESPDGTSLPPHFGRALRQTLQINDSLEREHALDHIFESWVSTDPEQALQVAPGLAPSELRSEILRKVVQAWATQDPERAACYVASGPTGVGMSATELSQIREQVFAKIAETNPVQAIQLLQKQGSWDSSVLMENLVQQWARVDLNAAAQWANGLPPSDSKDQFLKRIAFVWGQTDPSESARFIVDRISPGPVQTEAAVSAIHQWAEKDLKGATEWAKAFPPGPLGDRVLNEVNGVAQLAEQQAGRQGTSGH